MADKKTTADAEGALRDIERAELGLLISNGMRFDVSYKEIRRSKGLAGIFGKMESVPVTEKFEIHEPTLSTLDRLSAEWIELAADEEALGKGGNDTIAAAKKAICPNARRLARIVAIAVLGEDYYITSQQGSQRRGDDKELDRLTGLFYHNIKPSRLLQIANAITSISNFGDFIGSIRLMSAATTTKISKRIESQD